MAIYGKETPPMLKFVELGFFTLLVQLSRDNEDVLILHLYFLSERETWSKTVKPRITCFFCSLSRLILWYKHSYLGQKVFGYGFKMLKWEWFQQWAQRHGFVYHTALRGSNFLLQRKAVDYPVIFCINVQLLSYKNKTFKESLSWLQDCPKNHIMPVENTL